MPLPKVGFPVAACSPSTYLLAKQYQVLYPDLGSEVVFEIIRTMEFDRKASKIWAAAELAEVFKKLAQSAASGTHLGGGLYKIRVAASGRGKRGGARVIYLLIRAEQTMYLLDAYAKNEKDDLTVAECKVLRKFADNLRGVK